MRTGTKKLIAATLSLGLGITLAACGGSGADPAKDMSTW